MSFDLYFPVFQIILNDIEEGHDVAEEKVLGKSLSALKEKRIDVEIADEAEFVQIDDEAVRSLLVNDTYLTFFLILYLRFVLFCSGN